MLNGNHHLEMFNLLNVGSPTRFCTQGSIFHITDMKLHKSFVSQLSFLSFGVNTICWERIFNLSLIPLYILEHAIRNSGFHTEVLVNDVMNQAMSYRIWYLNRIRAQLYNILTAKLACKRPYRLNYQHAHSQGTQAPHKTTANLVWLSGVWQNSQQKTPCLTSVQKLWLHKMQTNFNAKLGWQGPGKPRKYSLNDTRFYLKPHYQFLC